VESAQNVVVTKGATQKILLVLAPSAVKTFAEDASSNTEEEESSTARTRAMSILKKSKSQLYVALNQEEIDESADGNNARPHRRRSFEFENLVRNENPDNLGSDGLGFMKQFGEYGAYFKVMEPR